MRLILIFGVTCLLSGCAASYQQTVLAIPTQKMEDGRSVVIITPADGAYETKPYAASGRMTAQAVRAAFAKHSSHTAVSRCRDLNCLQQTGALRYDYYVVPEILHWEDRVTEWNAIPDRLEVQISIYAGDPPVEIAASVLTGKSSVATLGGDHPQDLLPEPLNKYIDSLY